MSGEESFDTLGSLSHETLCEIVEALMETERDELATKFLRHMVDRDPSDAPAWCRLGYLSQSKGDVSEAEAAYRQAADADKDSIDGWVGLCLLRLENEDKRGAKRIYDRRLRGSKAFERRWHAAGMSYDDINNSTEVEFALFCAVAFKPRNIDVLLRFANITLWVHRGFAEAQSIYQQVISTDPESFYAWLGLGTAHMAAYDFEMARAAFERATEIAPSDPRPWHQLGMVLEDLDEHDAAERSYRTALDLSPNDPDIMIHLANTLELSGRTEEADELRHMSFLQVLRDGHK